MWKIVIPVFAAVLAVGLGALVGGFRDLDVNDEGARSALDFAVVQHNRGSNDIFLSQVAEVVKVESQVVSGLKYKITVKMGRTPCRKSDASVRLCAVHQEPEKALVMTLLRASRVHIHSVEPTMDENSPTVE